ncbi:MAG: hypothetical protein R3C58_15615 [Parvularculaceae bacterium]
MSTESAESAFNDPDFGWRAEAPRARWLAMSLFSWRAPGVTFIWACLAGIVFAAAAALSPALLSFSPTTDMIGPVAEARAVLAGEAALAQQASPLHLILLMAGDLFADAPGRVHLVSKAVGAFLVFAPFAYLAATRFPAFFGVIATAALSAFAAAPYSGPADLALALFLVAGAAFLTQSADDAPGRAWGEGALGGFLLFCLWLLHPVFALAGFVVLSVCPFVTGRHAIWRYAAALAVFIALAAIAEFLAPGVNAARADGVTGVVRATSAFAASESMLGLSGGAYGAALVIFSAAVFGGGAYWKNWAAAAGLMVAGLVAARIAGANALPVFALAAGFACFSVQSPFYDGVFRHHDRASVSAALTAAAMTLFWTGAVAVHAGGQFSLQYHVAKQAPADIRAELALVQPGGPTIAKWIEEGRFSTPEAREFLALAPVDQSAMLLEAASRARKLTAEGFDVAILTGADTACVLAERRDCQADGPAAARKANVVFVPRLDLDPKTTEAKGRSEALLYTQFRLVEQTALWDVWVRRDAPAAAKFFPAAVAQH